MHARFAVLLALAALPLAHPASGQLPGCWVRGEAAAGRASPLDSAQVSLDAGALKICYGSPSARGRTMVGGVEGYGQPWRLGANEATALHVTTPVEVAGVPLAPGSYSLYAIPTETSWTVVVNRAWQRWGIPISPDVRAEDVGEAVLVPERLDEPVEALRFRFQPSSAGAVDLLMEWEGYRLRIPVRSGA